MDVPDGPRLGCKLHTLGFEFGSLLGEIHGSPPANMIDCVTLAWRGVPFFHENPRLAILHSIHPSFQLRALTAKHFEIPLQGSFWVRRPQMDVVEAERLGILQDLDFGAPRVFEEGVLE